MKMLEGRESLRKSLPGLPVVIRIDGKGFSKWTRGLEYPFDERLETLRRKTTKKLIEELGATIGYHQSDEISLILYAPESQMYAAGRIQKLVSHAASIATSTWNHNVPFIVPEKAMTPAVFDARVWEVPSLEEAANAILWRELDATKNSISMATRSLYSAKEMFEKNTVEMQDMLHEKGVNWNDYPTWAKRGTYMGRRILERKLTEVELANLPPLHEALRNPDMVISRSEVQVLDMPIFSKIANRSQVILGADPILCEVKP